jgi:hypothetical protein
MKITICIFIFICLFRVGAYTQSQVFDSLKQLLQNEKQDSTRCLLLEKLGDQYQGSNPDSALIFAEQGIALARKIKYLKGQVICLSRVGTIYTKTGNGQKGWNSCLSH